MYLSPYYLAYYLAYGCPMRPGDSIPRSIKTPRLIP